VHHHTIQINQPTRCNNFSSLLLEVYLQLNMFRESSRPSSGAQQLQQQPLVLPLERGGSSAVGRGRAGSLVIVVLLVVVGPVGRTTTNSNAITTLQRLNQRLFLQLLSSWWWAWERPKDCWAVHKRQVINLRNCCIYLVDLFELYDDARTCKLRKYVNVWAA
jgi:hypothetical protein